VFVPRQAFRLLDFHFSYAVRWLNDAPAFGPNSNAAPKD